MRRPRLAMTSASLLMALLALPVDEAFANDCGGATSVQGLEVRCSSATPGSAPAPPGDATPSGLAGGWTVDRHLFPAPIGQVNACNMADGSPGLTWEEIVRDATGAIVTQSYYCVPVDAAAGPAAAPQPPTLDEIISLVPWPTPTTGTDPRIEGVTGLETRFWYSGQRSVSVSATLNGWSVTGGATAVGFRWRTGDVTLTANQGGSAKSPAALHTYETKGNYTLDLAVTWSGSFTVSGPGGTFTQSLPSIVIDGSQPYLVVEVRSVLSG
jgi:hypothetical protein